MAVDVNKCIMAGAVNWDDIEMQELDPGTIFRQVFTGSNMTLVMHTMYKGHPYLEPHNHPHEQILTIQQGQAKVFVQSEGDNYDEYLMGPGDMIRIAPNVFHTIEILSDEPVKNLDIFSPVREDYL